MHLHYVHLGFYSHYDSKYKMVNIDMHWSKCQFREGKVVAYIHQYLGYIFLY